MASNFINLGENGNDNNKREESTMNVRRSHVMRSSVVLMPENAEIRSIPTIVEVIPISQYDDVHISPNFIEFNDAREGLPFVKKIVIRNCGTRPAFIRIREPNSMAFQVKTKRTGIMLSPGLSFTSSVIYSFKRPALLRAIIPIEINDKVLDYCVICSLKTERISIKPMSIDFGIIDVGYTSEPKIITIFNEGGKTTRFSIDLGQNNLDITVKPFRGIIRPNRTVNLEVSITGLKEGTFCNEFWIKSTPNIRVSLKADVIVHRLMIYHRNTTEDFTIIDFPPTAEKTRKYNTFVLRNISSRACNYVVLGEVNNELKPIRKIDHKKFPVYGAFEINPYEGRMDSFESIIFEIGFCPTMRLIKIQEMLHRQSNLGYQQFENQYNDFMALIRIIKIHTEAINISVIDPIKKTMIDESTSGKVHMQETFWDQSSSLSSSNSTIRPIDNFVRICLYGKMEVIKLNLQPDSLYFGDLYVGEISQRVIRISNSSKIESVSFECQPMPAVKYIPKSAKLKPEGSIEVLVKVQARENVGPTFVISINATVDSEDSILSNYPTKVKIGIFHVICNLNVIFKSRTPMTQFVTGITPMITHEVEFMTNRATFGSDVKKPRQEMLFVENAYPNDTQKSLRPYRGSPVKTIFTGKPRYSIDPIHSETFTAKQANTINKHRLNWADYLHMSQLSRKKMLETSVAELFSDEDNENDIISQLTRVPKKYQELPLLLHCKEFYDKKLNSEIRNEIFIKLSPLQIYNVYVHPATINFGLVAWKTFSYRQLIASNRNEFSIKIQFQSMSKNIRFPDGDTIILQPDKITTKIVEFYGNPMGKFNNFINYNINDNHSFEINVIAEIVHKNLLIDKRDVLIGTNYLNDESYRPQWSIIQIKNKLDASTRYKWKIPEVSCFSIEPKYGTIRGNSILNTFISYKADPLKSSSAEMIIKCESGTFSRLRCNFLSPIPKVTFVNDRTNLGDLSLNLPTKVHGILHNLEFTEVFYEIDCTSLIRGCEIDRLNGIIPPRGIAILEATLKFDVCIDFTVTISVIVEKRLKLQWKVIGRVPFPRLKFTPNFIEQRRVIVDSFQSHLITVSNIGTTILKLQFALQEYPQFNVIFIPNKKNDITKENTSVLIPPRSTVNFYLYFQPLDKASYVIYLPIVINDLLGPVLETDPKTFAPSEYMESQKEFYKNVKEIKFLELPLKLPVISIDFTVAGRAVSFNKFQFVFDVATDNVSLNKQLSIQIVIDELKIDNPDKLKEVTVIIKTDNFIVEDCPFRINWSRGIKPTITSTSITCLLLPREQTVFSIEFKPICRGTFKLETFIFIRRDSEDLLFNTININGVNAKEFIEPDVSEIYLLPVPFNTPIEESFRLKAQYFENTTNILCKILPPDKCTGHFKNDMLNIKFPNGNIIPATSYIELDVIVSFKSSTLVSFCSKIEFHTKESLVVCSVIVYAAADNHLLTTHAYLRTSFDYCNKKMIYENEISVPFTEIRFSIIENETEEDDSNNNNNQQALYSQRQEKDSIVKSRRISYQESSEIKNKLKSILKPRISKVSERIHDNNEIDDADDNENIQNDKQIRSQLDLSDFSIDVSTNDRRISSRIMYPYFPMDNGTMSNYEEHMHTVLQSAEQWLYTNIFKYNFYANITDGITATVSIINQTKITRNNIKKESRSYGKSFVDCNYEGTYAIQCYNQLNNGCTQIFLNITLCDITDVSMKKMYPFNEIRSSLPQDDILRIDFILRQYEGILNFLLEQGACLAHVSPYFLLNYNDYVTFIDSTQFSLRKNKMGCYELKKLSKSLFESRSKQCWLDLILQTYKCLKLNHHNKDELIRKLTLYSETSSRRSTIHRESVSSNGSFRRVTNLHDPLKLIENVINLMQERRKVISDRSDEEVLLLSWLYHHYEEQRIQDWLTDKKITLNSSKENNILQERNIDNFDIILSDGIILIAVTGAYCAFLIEECFSNLYINPKNIEEAFHNATCLVTSWTTIRLGFVITPSQIVHPNSVQMLMLVTHLFENLPSLFIRSKLYQIFNTILTIKIPYTNAAEYEIWMIEEKPNKPSNLKMIKWSELRTRKVPRRLFLNQKSITVDEDVTEANLGITVACMTPTSTKFWLLCQSKTGDFIIQINSRYQSTFIDSIVVRWNNENKECTCTDGLGSNEDCPCNVEILIPSRNNELWNCISHMFQKTLDDKERVFWSRYLNTYIGLRLIHWLMGHNVDNTDLEFVHIFNAKVTYSVSAPEQSDFLLTLPKTFTINDVRLANQYVPMTVHLLPTDSQVYETTLSLTSEDGQELRLYAVSFLHVDE
ncbi:cilia- and flagella-associated protein 47-like [Polistes fuscatus]|uniref:cilia- and flagella-associated protein 47-like n=1 Tax=Polistes fuscatus TaxID=30207 RepID=UPI001CA8C7DD|nr:cilia- and flagella-associated protein 47-like [Polistes fuscatus]